MQTWKKFGAASQDPPGPNPANTTTSTDNIYMEFVNADKTETDDDPLDPGQQQLVKCRICKKAHWTKQCPYKDQISPLQDQSSRESNGKLEATHGDVSAQIKAAEGKYVPPSLRAARGMLILSLSFTLLGIN